MKRVSTMRFSQRAAARLESGKKLAEALTLPMLADIFETLDGPRPLTAFVLGPFQTFKSAAGQLHLARNMLVRPGAALWYSPTEPFSKEFADLKWNPLFDAQKPLTALQYKAAKFRGKLKLSIAGPSSLLILSANTEGDRHGKTARDLYLDEVHTYDPGYIGQIRNRRGSYPHDYLELLMSTGLTADTEAHQEWQKTTQKVWHWCCPACHGFFEPRYAHYAPGESGEIVGGLRYDRKFLDNGLPDEMAIGESLYHECPLCKARLPDSDQSRIALSGTAKAPRGKYVAKNARPSKNTHGWTFHAITVRPWLPIVMRFEMAQLARQRGDLEPLANCIREEFAGIWDPNIFLREKTSRAPTGYRMLDPWSDEGFDPQKRPVRFCLVDVQLDHFVVVVRKWNFKGRSRLHYCEKVTTPGRIDDLCHEHGVPPQRVFLDARHTPQTVRRLCAKYGWRSVMGEREKDYFHKDSGLRRIYSEPQMIDPFQGTVTQGTGCVLEVKFSKASALERLHLLRTVETNDGAPLWTDADDAPAWYNEEVNAFHRIAKKAADGSTYYEWVAPPKDHAADCEAIGIVAASMAGLTGAESLETPADGKKAE